MLGLRTKRSMFSFKNSSFQPKNVTFCKRIVILFYLYNNKS